VAGVWVGFDQSAQIRSGGSAAQIAAPIWADFMRRGARWLPAERIAPPPGLHAEEMCLLSYHRPVEGCPTYIEYFKDGDQIPVRLCPIHRGSLKQRVQRNIQGLLATLGKGIRRIFE
jgi:membrane carboxypeptidase/penicillin-binding protein